MTIGEKLNASKDGLDALLSYANGITGQTDPNIGDAIKTLCDGYSGSGGVPFKFGGTNPELISTFSEHYTLADTTFDPNGNYASSIIILPAVSNYYTNTNGSPILDDSNNDFVIVQTGVVTPKHDDAATNIGRQLGRVSIMVSHVIKIPLNGNSGYSRRHNANYNTNIIYHYHSSGALQLTSGNNSGFGISLQNPSISSAVRPNAFYTRIGRPSINVASHNIYESAENIKHVTDLTCDWTVQIYKVDNFSTMYSGIYDTICDILFEEE